MQLLCREAIESYVNPESHSQQSCGTEENSTLITQAFQPPPLHRPLAVMAGWTPRRFGMRARYAEETTAHAVHRMALSRPGEPEVGLPCMEGRFPNSLQGPGIQRVNLGYSDHSTHMLAQLWVPSHGFQFILPSLVSSHGRLKLQQHCPGNQDCNTPVTPSL